MKHFNTYVKRCTEQYQDETQEAAKGVYIFDISMVTFNRDELKYILKYINTNIHAR